MGRSVHRAVGYACRAPPLAAARYRHCRCCEPPLTPLVPQAMATCTRVLNALADCQRKHPREPYVCQHLQRAAAWCLFRQACPGEGGPARGCRRAFALMPEVWIGMP